MIQKSTVFSKSREVVIHTYNGILLSHKRNKIGSFVVMWMNIEFVEQSEASQKEKDKYCILTHTWNRKKRVRVSLNVQGGNRDADVENRVECSGGRRHSWDNQER